jgi:hypothetical protein
MGAMPWPSFAFAAGQCATAQWLSGDALDVARTETNAVNQQRACLENAQAIEERDGRFGSGTDVDPAGAQTLGEASAALRHELTLDLRLRDVQGHRQALVAGEPGRSPVQLVRDRVGRVR